MRNQLQFTLLLLLFGVLGFTGCKSVQYVSFEAKEDVTYSSPLLNELLREKSTPKVVLRTTSIKNVNEVDRLFDIMEKEFLVHGFRVGDRKSFVDENGNFKIDSTAGVDVIVELSHLDNHIVYNTSKVKSPKGKVGELGYNYKQYGASVEYKIYTVENNEFSGSYTFYKTPCDTDTPCLADKKLKEEWNKTDKVNRRFKELNAFEYDDFVKESISMLVDSMKAEEGQKQTSNSYSLPENQAVKTKNPQDSIKVYHSNN